MTTITVKTQAEFDAAFAKHGGDTWATILIDSPRGVWIDITASGSATVTAYGSATVTAYGSATVRAYDSATVTASGSATVTAYGSATVTASGSATVRAYDSATVTASKFVAVHLWSQLVTLEGGVILDLTALDSSNLTDWIDYTGANRDGDHITVYKAVNDEWRAGLGYRPTTYTIGETITCPDWRDDNECGGGYHLCPTPGHTLRFVASPAHFLECRVHVDDVRTVGFDKLKARKVEIVREVDIHGRVANS